MEIWKEVNNYEGSYWVSNLGRVKNRHGHILKPEYSNKGYACVQLRKDNKMKKHRVHRLVAEIFIPNPDGLPEVNHIDENKTHNRASNLEWCTHSQNMRAYISNHPNERKNNEQSVYCFDLDQEFESASTASVHTGVCRSSIVKACRGQLNQAGGKLWCYSKDKNKFTTR